MPQKGTIVTGFRRPRDLIRAARAGVLHYSRDRDLGFFPDEYRTLPATAFLASLLDCENSLEAIRLSGSRDYDRGRHAAVLSALIAESPRVGGQAKASGMDAFFPAT